MVDFTVVLWSSADVDTEIVTNKDIQLARETGFFKKSILMK